MGIKDKGEIVGLENDYKALGGGDKDRFELHLTNLVQKCFGEAFAATKVEVSFPEVLGIEICRVNISPSNSPTFIEVPNKDGQKSEKFFVRSGNSSQELSGNEAHLYIDDRFV